MGKRYETIISGMRACRYYEKEGANGIMLARTRSLVEKFIEEIQSRDSALSSPHAPDLRNMPNTSRN